MIEDVIFKELVSGKNNPSSKKKLLEVIDRLTGKGARGIILGCTELPHLLKPTDCKIKLYDTARLHAQAAVDFALKGVETPRRTKT